MSHIHRGSKIIEIRDIDVKIEDTSDVISYKYFLGNIVYTNRNTNKRSRNIEKVVRDRRFIVLSEEKMENGGIYVKHVKELDVVIVLFCRYVCTLFGGYWVELYRRYLDRDDTDFLSPVCDVFDICGETITKGPWSCASAVAAVGARKELMSFFGGPVVITKQSAPTDRQYVKGNYEGDYIHNDEQFFDFKFLDWFLTNFSHYYAVSVTNALHPVPWLINMKEQELPPLPNSFYDQMKDKAMNDLKDWFKKYGYKRELFYMENDCMYKASYLQRIDGSFVLRSFCTVFEYDFNIENTIKVDTVEYKRVKIESGISFITDCIGGPLIGYDDLKGTFLQYMECYLDYAVRSSKPWSITWPKISKYGNLFRDGLMLAVDIANNPLFEKLLNIVGEDNKFTILMRLKSSNSHVSGYMESLVGPVDNFSDFNKALGIPKGFLQYILENSSYCDLEYIRYAKQIFCSSSQSKEYFMRMDTASYQSLYHYITKLFYGGNCQEKINILEKLCKIFGYQNWHAYCDFLVERKEYRLGVKLLEYMHYLEIVDTIGEDARHMGWRINGSDVGEKTADLMSVYRIKLDESLFFSVNLKFFKQHDEWEKYLYEAGSYIIKYPESPTEIIREGTVLHHCAKQFVDIVAEGETMLLFVRRKELPDKPFYTLEVRNGAVRQCHGFDNRSIDEVPDLKEFLEKFCKEKNVRFDIGNRLLGPDE